MFHFLRLPFPAETERKTQDPQKAPNETMFIFKETGTQDREDCKVKITAQRVGEGKHDLYLIRQSAQEVPEIKAQGFLFSTVST